MMMNGCGGGMLLVSLLLLALVVGGVWLAVRAFRGADGPRQTDSATDQPSPRSLLDERFARGDIDREEYESRRDTLGL